MIYNVKNRPKVYLLHGNMSSKEIAALYQEKSVKCILSPTRGEGYGLPLIDAAAIGMPIVATNWSGHLEFLGDKNNFNSIDYEMIEINKSRCDGEIFLQGQKWAEPKEKSFKDQLSNVYNDYEEVTKKAKILSESVISNFNHKKIKNMYDNIFSLL